MNAFKSWVACLAMLSPALLGQQVHGAELPANTIRIVVPFAPGGAADSVARLVGQQVSQQSGKTIVVENHPGAGSIIGTELAARSVADGSTLVVVGNALVINKSLRPNLSYDPLTSFEPVCLLVDSPTVLVVNSSSPFRTLAEFLDKARAAPGELSYGTVGPASATHLAGEMLKRAAQVDLTYAPYAGAGPAVTALLGGHITAAIVLYSESAAQIRAGKLRPLAVTSRERFDSLRDVPTIAESGFKDYESRVWVGVLAPAKTPKDTVAQLSAQFASALRAPELKSRLIAQELYPAAMCGAEFGAYLQSASEKYGRVIKEANIKIE
jgi:tripartite-type tricarboxylate transporter receptor subunit TctC